MIKQKVSSQGFSLLWSVPASTTEYNSLAPKRANAVLEDAIFSTWYRNGANKFRDALCEAVEKATGVARINSGTEKEPKWEQEGKYLKRVWVEVATQRGQDPTADGVIEAIRDEYATQAQSILDKIVFDPSEKEATGGTPALAKTYIAWATEAIKKDGGAKLSGLLSNVLNTSITLPAPGTSGDFDADNAEGIKVLATAIAANEKRKRDAQLAAAKAEYGLEAAIGG